VITYPQLLAARPAAWRAAATDWQRLAGALLQRAEEVRTWAGRLATSWSGSAADAALGRLCELARALDCAAAVCLGVDQILAGLANRVAAAQAALAAAPAPDPAGEARLDLQAVEEAGNSAGPAPALAGQAGAALARAAAADDAAARRFGRLVADLPGGAGGPSEAGGAGGPGGGSSAGTPGWPAPTADPAAVRRWWDALAGADRRWLLTADPARLGRLGGVPVDIRDRANRLALAHRRHVLATAGDHAALRTLDTIHARLAGDREGRAYLLDLDPSGDGRAVIAIGDPDHAENVLTYVPGTGACLADLGKGVLLPATDRLAAAAGASTSVVLWLGYDAPDNPAVASSSGYAKRAEAALDRFCDGLRATHDGSRAHQSVLGHSYGSTVVGYTARDRGLDADDVIFVGSPGVGVTHAGDLGLPAERVWASTAAYDPIRLTVAGRALGSVLLPRSGDDLWFGPDPSRPGFGGRPFSGAPGSPLRPVETHDAYFDEANPAFDAVVDIATGSPP
jgi:hypothetical protein